MAGVPLGGLLSRAVGDLAATLAANGAGDDGVPSAPMWFGFLRVIPATGVVEQSALPERSRLSKRAVRQLIGATLKADWVEVVSGTGMKAMLRLTGPGRDAAVEWADRADYGERRWADRCGIDRAAMRAALAALVAQFDLELPHYPISYGSADFSVTGGRFRAAEPGPPRLPFRGQDWMPVTRGDRAAASSLHLISLLSQVLVAFTIDFENVAGSLVISEALARGFGNRIAVPLADG